MIYLFGRSLPNNIDTVCKHKHRSDDDTPAKRTTCGTFPFNLLKYMEDVPGNESNDINQSSVTSTKSSVGEQETAIH